MRDKGEKRTLGTLNRTQIQTLFLEGGEVGDEC